MRKGEKARRKLWAVGLVQLELINVLTGKPLLAKEEETKKNQPFVSKSS